jgi:small-conductance mechanosensitive channel
MGWDDFTRWLGNPAVIVALRVAGVLIAAISLTSVLRRAVRRVETRLAEDGTTERHAQRTRTLTRVLTSVGVVAIWVLAVLTILGTIPGFDVGPLIAGLGIGGVALGFGAQYLVRDVVTGFFILLEDQYGIGDIVEVNKSVSGTVEQLTLRLTGLRDIDGTLHYISNGNITQVSNRSKDWSGVLVDVKVAYASDLARVREVLEGLAREVKDDPALADDLLEVPAVLGVEAVEDSEVVVRLSAQVRPGRQFELGRQIRERIKAAFDEAKIEVQTN